ncbi:MAG: RNA polymerase sigma factor [Planctomycetota bacterium]
MVNDARKGDPSAFGRLVRQYQDWVFRLAYRMVWDAHEAKDLSQEVFLRLHRGFSKFDPSRPFGPWFFRLASNVCLNALKKRKGNPITFQILEDGERAFEPPDAGPGTVESAGKTDLKERVRKAVGQLTPNYRLIISLRYLKECSYEEIGGILDLPLGTVKNRLFRAREKLKRLLLLEGVESMESD